MDVMSSVIRNGINWGKKHSGKKCMLPRQNIKEQTEKEEKRIIQEGSEWCSFSDMGGEKEKGRRSLLKESLGIVVVITSSVIMVQRTGQEKIHYGIYLGFRDIFTFLYQ
jgi:hypothetical protein